jgi:hypothetical protein
VSATKWCFAVLPDSWPRVLGPVAGAGHPRKSVWVHATCRHPGRSTAPYSPAGAANRSVTVARVHHCNRSPCLATKLGVQTPCCACNIGPMEPLILLLLTCVFAGGCWLEHAVAAEANRAEPQEGGGGVGVDVPLRLARGATVAMARAATLIQVAYGESHPLADANAFLPFFCRLPYRLAAGMAQEACLMRASY